jgi:peptide/nickel transport system ATP-binding protein
MILITHDIYTAINTSDRIAILYLGYVIEITDTKNFSGDGENLLHPYTRSLYRALPETDFELTEGHQPSYLHIPKGCPYHENCPRQVEECSQKIPELRELNGTVIRCFNPLVDGD